jgi:NitT/TauT family transport system ATP-binding protein
MLNIQNVYHQFDSKPVLHNINLQVQQGQFLALVGASGSGKSTLFRGILGTHPLNKGRIIVDNKDVNGPSRDIGIVYQSYDLPDFLTAEQNVAFGLKLDQTNIPFRFFKFLSWYKLRQKHLAEARELLNKFGLGHAVNRYSTALSGGMRQRVAIAQAMILQPKILLLDEPFGALDESTREELQMMLLKLYQENVRAIKENLPPPYTLIIVTHELNEAFYVADRVIGLSRYWQDGIKSGLKDGATITYDKAAPVYTPDEPRDFSRFLDLKTLLRKVVFDGEEIGNPTKHCTFWKDKQ